MQEIPVPDEWLEEKTLRTGEVAEFFSVTPKAVTRWTDDGLLGYFRLPNGDRRIPMCEVRRMAAGGRPPSWLKEYAEQDLATYSGKGKDAAWRRGRATWLQNHGMTDAQDSDE